MTEEWVSMAMKGSIAGFLMAAPVGPVALMCLKRTLSGHTFLGFIAGMGATLADVTLALFACFSLHLVGGFLDAYADVLRLMGGTLILVLGMISLRQKPFPQQKTPASSFGAAFFLTLCNPLTIVAFAATFSALGVSLEAPPLNLSFLVVGVFFGASLWWGCLVGVSRLVRQRFGLQDVWRIHQASSLIFILFGGGIITLAALRFFQP